ncbi:hypothetical protein [Ferrovibrio terrae]|uniref:hypothetical protein n=1 Tax=Ferrovibrio terrae TaxID=2594003 RepID=UPI0031377968
MPVSLICSKHLSGLRPVDQAGLDAIARLGMGEMVMVEIKRPRNIKHHRLYWALVGLVWENLDHERYPTPDSLHAAFKVCLGIRTEITMPGGTIAYIPGSISFEKMDQAEFSAFYDRVCDLIAKHFLPGVTNKELRAEICSMTGTAA